MLIESLNSKLIQEQIFVLNQINKKLFINDKKSARNKKREAERKSKK